MKSLSISRRGLVLPFLACLVASGCASITQGKDQALLLTASANNSEVKNATCVLTNDMGQWTTTTPGRVEILKSASDMTVQCTKPDYKADPVQVPSSATRGFWGNLLFGGPLGMYIDYSTGAGFGYPDTIDYLFGPGPKKSLEKVDENGRRLQKNAEKRPEMAAVALQLNNTGNAALKSGNFSAAETAYQEALRTSVASDLPLEAWSAASNLMGLYSRQGTQNNPYLAILYGKRAINSFMEGGSETGRLSDKAPGLAYGTNADVYENLSLQMLNTRRHTEAEQVMRLHKERELFELINPTSDINSNRRLSLNDTERTLEADPQQSAGPAGGRQVSMKPEKNIRLQDGVLLPTTTLTSLSKLLAKLDTSAMALQYTITEDQVAILVSTPKGSFVRTRQVPQKELERLVFSLRTSIANRLDHTDASQQLWKLLIEPVQPFLQHFQPKTLVLGLSGRLRYLPFAALSNMNGRYLVEDYALVNWSHAAGARLGLQKRASEVEGLGLSQARLGQAELPRVREELYSIVKTSQSPEGLFPGRLALDQQFDESRFLDALKGKTGLVHVASHFSFKPGDAKKSVLYLGEGEPLSLQRLSELNYSKVELIALSACDTATGGGVDERGIEVEGLAAILLKNHAGSVLGSLWKVSDESTAQLMKAFYASRITGIHNQAETLRQAQLGLLRAPGGRFNHPFHWASFTLNGAWI